MYEIYFWHVKVFDIFSHSSLNFESREKFIELRFFYWLKFLGVKFMSDDIDRKKPFFSLHI